METLYNNLQALNQDHPQTVKELTNHLEKSDWQGDELYYYPSLEDFAKYELTEGWYSDNDLDRDYNGAPNLINYIDLEALGEALSNTWDESCHYLTSKGEVIETPVGW